MTFTRPCWSADQVSAVMNPDAENIADDVFLAVHFDHELIMVDPGARSGGEQQRSARHRWQVAPDAFLHNFLTSDRRQAYAAVLGAAGSGKSHFIHWLALNIPQRDDLYVLSIPKTGTNLRGVLERIIDVLPTDRAMKYREVLNATGYSSATQEQRQERLLSEIALSIGALQVQSNASDPEAEEWLISELPTLFHDPHYRARISQPNGIIEQLVEHISEPSRIYERREERRAFRLDDLPLSGVATLNLSLEARKFFNVLLSNQHLVPLAVQIINRSLNAAISGVLNFRGDQLLELMLDVRRYLRAEGKALVLLIEDLARLQGVDTALLQALIEAPSDGPEGLCDLRWAAAVTRGYYEQLPDTVKSRMDFLIDMDLPLDTLGPDSIAAFAARYLKAVRLQKDELLSWYNTGLDSGSRAPVPNRCDDCPYREECHASFGAIDGVGLYPFNQAALRTMAERKDPDIFDRFNPRRFIKMVLSEVMGTRRQEIVNGEFPDNSLLQYMGGSQLPPPVEDQLKRANPIDFERQRTVLELWGIPGQPVSLPDGLYTAFSLKPPILPRSSSPASTTTNSPDTEPYRQGLQEPIVAPPQREDRFIQAVRRWAQGGNMPQWIANDLRDLIYTALEDYIDWDTVGLERKRFMQQKGNNNVPFLPRHILFLRQETQEFISSTSINLRLPLDTNNEDDLRRTAIALETLLQFKSRKSWDFPDALQGLVVLGECLEQWSTALLAEFKRPPGTDTGWDPVASAVEVLAVGAAIGGKLSASKLTTTDKLNILFDEKWPDQLPDQAAGEWGNLYEDIHKNVDKLREIVRTWASATKGGQVGAMVNPLLLLPPLKHILRTWKLTNSAPDNIDQMREPYRRFARLQANVRATLPQIVASEYRRRMEWLELVRRYMDEDTTHAQVVESARQLGDSIANEGISVHQSVRKKFDEALEAFKTIPLDNAIKAAQQLRGVADPIAALPALVPRTASAMMAADRFFAASDALITETEAALKTKLADLDARVGEQLQRDLQVIGGSLEKLEQALSVIGGEAC